MKKIALVFLTATLLYGCTCSEEKCREKYPCPEMTKEECITQYGLSETGARPSGPGCITNISQTTATEYINRFVASHAEKTGMFVPPCALYQAVVDSAASAVGLSFGLAPDNTTHSIIIKYQTATGTIYWGNVEFSPDFGEPHCPPGSKCS